MAAKSPSDHQTHSQSARPACASHLSRPLGNVVSNLGDVHCWLVVLNWTRLVLVNPKRGGKHHNVALTVKKRLTSLPESSTAQWPTSLDGCVPISARHSKSSMSDAIAAKMEDGNVRAAVRLLCSDEEPAPGSTDTLNKLQLEHPKAPADQSDSPAMLASSLSVDEAEVFHSLLSSWVFWWVRRFSPSTSAGFGQLSRVWCRSLNISHSIHQSSLAGKMSFRYGFYPVQQASSGVEQ